MPDWILNSNNTNKNIMKHKICSNKRKIFRLMKNDQDFIKQLVDKETKK